MKNASINLKTLIKLAFFFDLPISTAYIVPFFLHHGVSQAGVFLLQSIFSIVFLIWSIPSGYLADKYGRAFAIQLGAPIAAVAMFVYGFQGHFWQYAICEVGLALGEGLISGANQALLINSLAKLKKEREFVKVSQRMQALTFAGTALGVPIAILLITKVNLGSTLVADGLLYGIGAVMALKLKDLPGKKDNLEQQDVKLWKALWKFAKLPNIRWLLILTSALGSASYLAFWLTAPYYLSLKLPLAIFSILLAVRSAWKAWLSHKFHKNKNIYRNMQFYSILVLVAYIGMATKNIWLIWTVLAVDIVEALQGPPIVERINSFVEEKYRATMNSIVNLAQRLVYVVAGPLLGLTVDKVGLRDGLVITGLICFVFSVLAINKSKLKLNKANRITSSN